MRLTKATLGRYIGGTIFLYNLSRLFIYRGTVTKVTVGGVWHRNSNRVTVQSEPLPVVWMPGATHTEYEAYLSEIDRLATAIDLFNMVTPGVGTMLLVGCDQKGEMAELFLPGSVSRLQRKRITVRDLRGA